MLRELPSVVSYVLPGDMCIAQLSIFVLRHIFSCITGEPPKIEKELVTSP